MSIDIGSGSKYPANALSNFSPHPFVIDEVECNSMEGFLQGLKFKDEEMQKFVCTLVGKKAKFKGKKKKWWRTQTLHWKGIEIKRDSKEYTELLNRAYTELSKNSKFAKALLSSGDSKFTHSIGNNTKSKTVLTVQEFCSILNKLRNEVKEKL